MSNNLTTRPDARTRSIRSIMQREVITCSTDTTLQSAMRQMVAAHCSAILVVDHEIPVGIWTEADALKLDYHTVNSGSVKVCDLMSSPLRSIDISASLDEATYALQQFGVRHLVVTDTNLPNQVCGIISQSDVIIHQDAEYFMRMNEIGSVLPSRTLNLIDQSELIPAAVAQMREAGSDYLLVTKRGEPSAILTERDVVRLVADGNVKRPLKEVANKPLIKASESMSLLAARSLMEKRHIRHLCVVDANNQIKGVISFSDVLANIEQSYVNRLRNAFDEQPGELNSGEASLQMANAVIEASMDGIMVTDEQGVIISVNPAFTLLTGYSESEALGKSPDILNSGKHTAQFYQQMWQQIGETGSWKGEIWNRRKNGEIFPEWLTITTIHDARQSRKFYAAIFSDITDRKRSEAILENLSYYDPLTKLPNRQLLFDRMRVALSAAHRDQQNAALLFIDLDLFKRINDTLGYSVGDEALCNIARRLQERIREADTIARIGGDELVILISEMESTHSVHRVIKRVFAALEEGIEAGGQTLHITASVGCALYPQDGIDQDALLKHSESAMHRAKHLGRNSFQLYSAGMSQHSRRQLDLENRLYSALANRELFLLYQPKHDLQSGTMTGVEALLRWQDKTLGVVPPDQFIPVAEELGLIGDIGAWVLQEACHQARLWAESNPGFTMSVNVSPQQFSRRNLVSDVESALARSGLNPRHLDLEITESCVATNLDEITASLHHLRQSGITVSMDDFGTGYSSLSMLSQLPLDQLKIDRSFISGMTEKATDRALVSTILLMAKNLGLQTVAEGIESETQKEQLTQMGCDHGQGYLFARPLPADEISQRLRGGGD